MAQQFGQRMSGIRPFARPQARPVQQERLGPRREGVDASVVERTAEAGVGRTLAGQERMFATVDRWDIE